MVHSIDQEAGPVCQSCGMPMRRPDDFGRSSDGTRCDEYCHFCFVDGHLIDPDMTMQAMIDKCTAVLAQRGAMSEPQVRMLMADTIPRLKRWRGADKSYGR